WVTLHDHVNIKATDIRAFAEELVRFARAFDFPPSGEASPTSFPPDFPLLIQYVHRVRLKKVGYYAAAWSCTNASVANVGFCPDRVAGLILDKSQKRYAWGPNSAKWLLVCASGAAVVGTAGPRLSKSHRQEPEIQAACKASPFDHIYFWDRVHGWSE